MLNCLWYPAPWIRSVFGIRGSFCLILLAWGGACAQCWAHDPGLSALALQVTDSAVVARLTMAEKDVEGLLPAGLSLPDRSASTYAEALRASLEPIAMRALEVDVDGQALTPIPQTMRWEEPADYLFVLEFPARSARHLLLRSALLYELPKGHRQLVSLKARDETLVQERLLDANNDLFEALIPEAGQANVQVPSSFFQFLWLGIEHIVTGYDHLVFLFGLLIVGGCARDVFKIITAFTLAHSITLALATLNVIRLSGSLVEPLIAISIVYVGIENLFRKDLERRWMLAFGFGLIHGCGFASVLRDLGIGQGGQGVLMPLLSFNLGVELGQAAIAAVMLPLIWQWKQRPIYQVRVAPAFSFCVIAAGSYWLLQRTLLG